MNLDFSTAAAALEHVEENAYLMDHMEFLCEKIHANPNCIVNLLSSSLYMRIPSWKYTTVKMCHTLSTD